MATKKVVTKTATAAKAETTEAFTNDKVTEKKAPAKKTVAKKAPAKKTTAKKEIKVSTIVQCFGKEVSEKDIIANVKKAWTKAGNKIGDIKTIELYIKPEENAVYYVINTTESGAIAL